MQRQAVGRARARAIVVCALAVAALVCVGAPASCAPSATERHARSPTAGEAGNSLSKRIAYHESHTPAEWIEMFKCSRAKNETASSPFQIPLANIWQRVMEPECRRDMHSWRYRYVDEFRSPGAVLVRDASVDERLANIIQTIILQNMFDNSFSYFNSGDPERDARNQLAVAGPAVDEAQCARDLARMSALFDELQERVSQARAAADSTRAALEPRHIQLARVLDSYGRYESGLLDGKTWLVGTHEECEANRLLGSEQGAPPGDSGQAIKMRYCVANLNSSRRAHPALQTRKRFPHENAPGLLSAGVCLPRSCHSKSLHRHRAVVQKFVDSQLRLPAAMYVHETYELESLFCLVDRDSEYARLPMSGKLCLLVLTVWTLLCVVATLLNKWSGSGSGGGGGSGCDQLKLPKGGEMAQRRPNFAMRVSQHFDLVQSWRELTSDKRPLDPGAPLDLDMLNPIKLFCSVWCIACHTSFMLGSISAGQGRIAAFVDLDPGFQVALLTYTVIDTFFAISGMLTTYVVVAKLHKLSQRKRTRQRAQEDEERCEQVALRGAADKGAIPSGCNGLADSGGPRTRGRAWSFMVKWFGLAANRYLRIVPLYVLFFWFRRDVLTYLGSGPLWDYGLNRDTPTGACLEEPWWLPFTFWSAFLPMAKQCYIPSWSISNDIFFGLLMPPVLVWYNTRPRLALTSVLALILVNSLATLEAALSSSPGLIWEMLEARMAGVVLMFTGLSHLYTWPFFRASSYLAGSLGGYFLFRYNQMMLRRQGEQGAASRENTGWPRWVLLATRIGWLYLALHFFISFFSNYFRGLVEPYHRLVAVYWLAPDRTVWSCVNVLLFSRLVTDWRHNTFVRHFASQKWRTLSKLNYPVMFIHWILIIVYLGLLPSPAYFTMWQISAAVTVITVASMPLATLVHLMFENPIDKIVKREILRF